MFEHAFGRALRRHLAILAATAAATCAVLVSATSDAGAAEICYLEAGNTIRYCFQGVDRASIQNVTRSVLTVRPAMDSTRLSEAVHFPTTPENAASWAAAPPTCDIFNVCTLLPGETLTAYDPEWHIPTVNATLDLTLSVKRNAALAVVAALRAKYVDPGMALATKAGNCLKNAKGVLQSPSGWSDLVRNAITNAPGAATSCKAAVKALQGESAGEERVGAKIVRYAKALGNGWIGDLFKLYREGGSFHF